MRISELVSNYSDPNSLGSRLRRRRSAPLSRLIESTYRKEGTVSILDIGGMEYYWNIFEPEFLMGNRVTVVLLNLEKDVLPVKRDGIFRAVVGDGCCLGYEDKTFDICHSNSVIEHVGLWSRKVAFAREVRRVAQQYFVQTPNFWFPWEPHFGLPLFHWMPEPTRLWIARHRRLAFQPRPAQTVDEGMEIAEHANMLNAAMMRYLFPDGAFLRERVMGLTKSFVSIRST